MAELNTSLQHLKEILALLKDAPVTYLLLVFILALMVLASIVLWRALPPVVSHLIEDRKAKRANEEKKRAQADAIFEESQRRLARCDFCRTTEGLVASAVKPIDDLFPEEFHSIIYFNCKDKNHVSTIKEQDYRRGIGHNIAGVDAALTHLRAQRFS